MRQTQDNCTRCKFDESVAVFTHLANHQYWKFHFLSKATQEMANLNLSQALAESGLPAVPLQAQDAKLLQAILDAWTRHRQAVAHHPKSILRDIRVIFDFMSYSGLPPWLWQEDEFESWSVHLGTERGLANASQRQYQSVIRKFLGYLCDNVKFRNDIRRLYRIEIRQICHPDNCIPHTVEREIGKEKRALTHAEIAQFFDAIDRGIQEAAKFRSKDLRPLQRDKAFFFTQYTGGLRISECIGLNTTSFQPNPKHPELGRYGFIHVMGKGSRGSGKRFRQVPVDHIGLPPLLEWYAAHVRPAFLANADANEPALFLSQRGKRPALSSMEARFHSILALAGLEGLGLTTHCLRHSCGTHGSLNYSMEAVRRKLGHSSVAVTQTYLSVPDQFVEEEITLSIKNQIDEALDNGS